jgi:ABC-type sugar transport system ATPase subunit
MRAEIKRLHIDQNATTVYVTHDQIEAMALGDRIVVMSDAVVQQAATPFEVYSNPANIFVARFIGSPGMNLVPARYQDGMVQVNGSQFEVDNGWRAVLGTELGSEGKVIVGFRPEAARVNPQGKIAGTTYANDLHGGYSMLHVELTTDQIVHVRSGRETNYQIGDYLRFDLDPDMVRFFHPETEVALYTEETHP